MRSMADGAARLKRQFQSGSWALPLSDSSLDSISRIVGHRGRRCFWSPAVTVMTFLHQILGGNISCRHAVAKTLAGSPVDENFGGARQLRISGDPSAYAQARSRLPLAWFAALHRRVADALLEHVAAAQTRTVAEPARGRTARSQHPAAAVHDDTGPRPRWCGRRAFVVDGSTVSMPDTPSLQRAFPQPAGQKRGCGFPQARLTAVFCHASGALLDLALDSLRLHELTLLRRMLEHFQPGDVLVADRAYHSYANLCEWTRRGLDAVLRLNEAAWPDLRTRRRLGRDDQIALWHRPRARTRRLTPAQWAELPETLTVRLIRIPVTPRGFRSRRLEIVTTLLDAETFPADQIAALYRGRWQAELNLRSLKTTLKMEVLHGRSPDIVRKEVMMYAVTYNLIRTLMWHAAVAAGRDPRRLSFAGTLQRIDAALPEWDRRLTLPTHRALLKRLLDAIAADALPDRPNRIEPRAVKRRPKSYSPLSIPRERYRRELLKTHAA